MQTRSWRLTANLFLCGFTLLEILVVLVIVGVLAGLAVPMYQRVVEGGRATGCISNLRNIGAALNLYLAENNMTMPTLKAGRASLDDDVPVIDNTLQKYAQEKAIFACPSDKKYAAATGTSYSWNSGLNGQSATNLNFLGLVKDTGHIPILGDKEGFHPYTDSKVNILYADGHATKEVKFFTEK
jgi:prepilin-type N-terminal cleavage/methylation domain-containing protein/prepilin-type processing-associated H-X9-DG protein